MRVLHYIPSIDKSSGGVGAYMQLLAKDLGKLVDLHVVTHRSKDELVIENAQLHYIDHSILSYFSIEREFKKLLDEIKPDVFHANCCWDPFSSLTTKWAKQEGYPCVYTPHGMLEPWILARHHWSKKVPALMLYQRNALKIADCLHATAESEKLNIAKLGYNPNIVVVPNCVDISDIKIKDNWQKKRKILFLSRIHIKKGIEFLIQAVADLKEKMSQYEVIIAGQGDDSYIDSLKQMARNLGIEKNINFIGGVYADKKWQVFQEADAFVLPTFSENFGIVVAEALASGTPVITTKGTPWQELQTEHCGWWTEIGAEGTRKALKEMIDCSEEELETMGKNGRKLIESKYSSTIVARQMMNLYSKILK